MIPNGVDEQLVSESFERIPREEACRELGVEPHTAVLITASRLVYKNGIDDVIRALAHLSMPASLVVAGDGPERGSLKRLAKSLGVEKRVFFLGTVPHEKLFRYYRMSDIFVRPSRSEGLGNVFLEAMGAGLPVVATQVGGIVDFLEDGKTGIAVRPNDPEDVARGIERLIEDRALRDGIVERGRQLVIERYLWVDGARRMQAVFEKLMV